MSSIPIAEEAEPRLSRSSTWLLLAAALACVVLRARFVGHLVLWDEAMALCTARSFVAGGQDHFSLWFWRHPPLFSLLTLAFSPLSPGFAERVEWLGIGVACVNLLLLFRLNATVFGATPAAWSAVLLATLPGSVFFDTWVKTDHTVTTFGLLALLALRHNRVAYAGLSLGLALLSKETAAFYFAAALLVFVLAEFRRPRWLVRLGLLGGVPVVAMAWWYLLFAGRADGGVRPSLSGIFHNVAFAVGDTSVWGASWSFYLRQLPTLLGWPGVVLTLAGSGMIVAQWLHRRRPASGRFESKLGSAEANRSPESCEGTGQGGSTLRVPLAGWPLALLLVSYLPLSLLPNKVPWVIICILPAFATLQAVGLCSLASLLRSRFRVPRSIAITAPAVFAAALIAGAWVTQDYDQLLQKIAPNQRRGALFSRQIAEKMNELVKPGDRILLSSFHYWTGLPPGQPCAVFTYYFTKGNDTRVLLRPHTARGPQLLEDIARHELDWAVLSPAPGEAAKEVFGVFSSQQIVPVAKLEGAWVFDTRRLRDRARAPAP